MIWLAWKLLTLPIRTVTTAIRLVFRTIRFVGLSRILAFGAGVGVGLAVAPTTGAEFRARLAASSDALGGAAGDIGAAVRHELANSPRTWHLPQPTVTETDGRVTLAGRVPDDDARLALVRTAGAVVGVRTVDDQLVVDIP